jgi:hypothetical protein
MGRLNTRGQRPATLRAQRRPDKPLTAGDVRTPVGVTRADLSFGVAGAGELTRAAQGVIQPVADSGHGQALGAGLAVLVGAFLFGELQERLGAREAALSPCSTGSRCTCPDLARSVVTTSPVTVNLLLPGGGALTGLIPEDLPEEIRSGLLPASVMAEPTAQQGAPADA